MTVAVVVVLATVSVVGYVLKRRSRKPLAPREAGRVVIASNLHASRRR